ncbi:phosphatidylserine/phosphatidylglycerophosphate/cardiolipin synthase-like enzyme [Azospirillum sp. OGB3]|uniref:phospholipase D-like domain-containing protein n=1 Tax=Azospirillum sp. OGB3 TaxID=2587012 RepID=UPI001606597B|nr:phospholipase D-like domain-containing protein [Azospirillum sp. OGB3]MBB3265207.1 phosphatidylserine/phosphatidylglycerophosphate/cardiolipin synthase-like enzyme [Azospirillum sp. OGB3]
MTLHREQQRFPTRNYPYGGCDALSDAAPDATALPQPNVLYRRIGGLDMKPRPITTDELPDLDDPFGRLLRSGQPFPLSLRAVLAAVDALDGTASALPDQLVFLVADGGHIPWSPETDRLQRSFRFAVARGNGDFPLLISSSTVVNSAADPAFLQVIGWDATHEVFHYYERLRGTFFWAGASPHALAPPTRGHGPFDSHVNGSLVMKELRSPWQHWHAPQAGINNDALAPDDPLRDDPLFTARVTAERLETEVVKPGIRRWNAARVRKAVGPDGVWRQVGDFLRQAVSDTTVNLTTSETASHLLNDASILRPPLSFFINRDTLFDTLGLVPGDPAVADIAIPGALYLQCLTRYGVHRSDGAIRIDGDTHFAFLTPEPAFEDTQLVDEMVQAGLLGPRFVACLAMVDFPNPVFSPRRAALLRYIPDAVGGSDPARQLETQVVAALETAVATGSDGAGQPGSPEREFLANWTTEHHEAAFIARITAYFQALRAGMVDATVVDGWFRLAEHRRRRFRCRPLAEFTLTTPRTNIPADAPALRMTETGRVETITTVPCALQDQPLSERRPPVQRFDPPGFLNDFRDDEKDQWSQLISGWLDEARAGVPEENDGPRPQFFNALTNPPAADARVATISWNAFPRQVKSRALSDKQRWRVADGDRNLQDEYCEWSVSHDPASGKILHVSFTCEGPEYWEVLATLNPDKVVDLYREFVSPRVKREDLFLGGRYNRQNRFNRTTTDGAMHLIQRANSLRAEIELGAAATIRRIKSGVELSGAQELILCSAYGEPGRNSDPYIGEQVNALARQRAEITLNNPVGLYFEGFNPVGWRTPDGADPREFWRYVRGSDEHFVRAVFEVPPDRGYTVSDITIAGRPIEFGAQIVDFVTIKLEGLATRFGQATTAPLSGCRVRAPAPVVAAAAAPSPLAAQPPCSRAPLPATPMAAATPAAGGAGAAERTLADLPEALRRRLDIELTEGAAPPFLVPYPKLPPEQLRTRYVSGRIMAYASPDSTYAVTSRLIDSARQSIVIGLYDFSAGYMKELLKRALRRGVSVSLMLDTNDADDPNLFAELGRLGARCVRAPSSSAGHPNAYFGNAHEKIIVVDGEIVMIQSGNWSENSIPFNEGDGVVVGRFETGNRDMGVAVHSRELADFFAALVARDMRLSEGLPPESAAAESAPAAVLAAPGSAASLFFEAAPSNPPTKLFPSLTVTPGEPVAITPVVTPENFEETLEAFLGSAVRSIRIEQQYIRGGQSTVDAMLRTIQKVRNDHPELSVQIIVSPKYLYGEKRQKFLDSMAEFKLDFDDNFRFLSARHFVHCHNKLIVVDERRVLIGSQNWSTTGIQSNREASLLVEHAGIAGYFANIFDEDWALSEPEATFSLDPLRRSVPEVTVADFTKGRAVVSSARDYAEV